MVISVNISAMVSGTNQNFIVLFRRMIIRIFIIMLWAWAGVCYASNLYGGREPTDIKIDIKPDDATNIFRPNSSRVISAAIFGSKDLDIISINPRTIRLNGVDIMLVGKSDKNMCRSEDINDDSFQDLVCDVRTTGFRVGEGEFDIIIKASTYTGESLEGRDKIRIEAD